VLAGKSMGSRIGCHVATETDAPVRALVCLGYPLRAAGSGKLRDAVLLALTVPILFVQGTRDALCPLDLLAKTRREMSAPNELYVVEAGDHSLAVTKSALRARGETQDDVEARILDVVRAFLRDHVS
jgi:predicted alpha/beta-hydrolase family hydrolase